MEPDGSLLFYKCLPPVPILSPNIIHVIKIIEFRGKNRTAQRVLVIKLKETDLFEGLGIDEKIMNLLVP